MIGSVPFSRGAGRVFIFFLCLFLCFVLSETFVFAQDKGWWDESGNFVHVAEKARYIIFKIARGVILLAGGFSLMMLGIAVMNGEKDSLRRFGMWAIGLSIGGIVLSLLLNISVGNRSSSHGGLFNSSFTFVKNVVSILLNIVCIVTVVSKVVQVINGEKDGGRQLFRWFAVSVIGQGLVSVI